MTIYNKEQMKKAPRADMYLPDFLLGFGIFLGIFSILLFVFTFVYDEWFLALIGLALLTLGVFAYLCWKNQKIHIISEDFFEYTTMFGKTTRYAFSEIREIKGHTDSVTIVVGSGKVHIEGMAILTQELLEKIDIAMGRREAPKKTHEDIFQKKLPHFIEQLSNGTFVSENRDGSLAYLPYIHEMTEAFYMSDIVDYQYMKSAPELMKGMPDILKSLTKEQLKSCITFVFRSEHFGEGQMLHYLEDGTLLALMQRLADFLKQD